MRITPDLSWLRAAAALAVTGAALACGNAGEKLGFGPLGTGGVQVLVYLDRDGSGNSSGSDTVFAGIRVALLVAGTTDTVATGTSDSQGLLQLPGIAAGNYRLTVDTATVPDSVRVLDTGPVLQLRAVGQPQLGQVRLGYPPATVAEARQLPPGELVIVTGTITAVPSSFSDTTAYLEADSVGIRLTAAQAANFSLSPGDSVRVVGVTATRNGQPVLDQARIYFFSLQGGSPVPLAVTTLQAASAGGGALDARLVAISAAVISDTATVTPDFRITADDGSGSVEVLLDPRVTTATGAFGPGKTLTATGVLVPLGGGVWELRPRAVADISVQ